MRTDNTRNLFHDLSSVSNRLLDTLDDIRKGQSPLQSTDHLLLANALIMRTTTVTNDLNLLGSPSLLSVSLTKLCARQKQRIAVTGTPPLTLFQLSDWCDLCNAISLYTACQPSNIIELNWLSVENKSTSLVPLLCLTSQSPLRTNDMEASITAALSFSRCQANFRYSEASLSMTLVHSIDALVRIDNGP